MSCEHPSRDAGCWEAALCGKIPKYLFFFNSGLLLESIGQAYPINMVTHAATATIITLQGFLLKMATPNLVLELHAGTVEQRG